LYEHRNLQDFKRALPRIVLKLIPADFFSWMEFAFGGQPRLVRFEESDKRLTSAVRSAMESAVHSHPFTRHFVRTGDSSALKPSDFMDQPQVRESIMGQQIYRAIGVRYLLSVSTTTGPGFASAVSFCNETRDFTERDRLILNLVRPHIVQARRNAELSDASALKCATFRLSDREGEVVRWLTEGKTNSEIAVILHTSPRTIEKHMEHILVKVGVENRTAVVAMLMGPKLADGPRTRSTPADRSASLS
jgi:DNA-binding CsgD family transcriptional regulator